MHFNFRSLINLIEGLLFENISKGGQQVIKNAEMVANLAKRARRDSRMNAASFPPGTFAKFEKMNDQQVAEWFISQLDQIEQTGYEGVTYSRDGANHAWIVSKYILGAHNWEDISGTMSMTLSKFYFLKNRNMLDAAHTNIPSFKSIREIGEYMVYHYQEALAEYNAKMKAAAMKKSVRAYLIVDNDDYKIYTTLNRVANIAIGQGTTWCTTSSDGDGTFWRSYSGRAMLFQLFPYEAKEVSLTKRDGRKIEGKERFQFDAGMDFMDIADNPVDKRYVREEYPYIYDDLVTGLRSKKADIENYIKTHSEDPALQTKDTKVKEYNLDVEIARLQNLVSAGWLTTKKRPIETPPEENPELPAPNV
jgi:hypothetical protein